MVRRPPEAMGPAPSHWCSVPPMHLLIALSVLVFVTAPDDEAFVVVSRHMVLDADTDLPTFKQGLRGYLDATRAESGLHHAYVRLNSADDRTVYLYEVYTSEQALQTHYKQAHYREHQKLLVDQLRGPVVVRSLPIPASWFPAE